MKNRTRILPTLVLAGSLFVYGCGDDAPDDVSGSDVSETTPEAVAEPDLEPPQTTTEPPPSLVEPERSPEKEEPEPLPKPEPLADPEP